MGEANTPTCQPIQVGGDGLVVALEMPDPVVEVVDGNKKNVRFRAIDRAWDRNQQKQEQSEGASGDRSDSFDHENRSLPLEGFDRNGDLK